MIRKDREQVLKHNALDPFALGALPVIALMSAITTIGWAEYNRLRFAKADQRKRRRTVLEPEVDQRLGVPEQLGSLLRHNRISSVAMDKFARPVGVRVVRHR
ncbi:poly-beta-1,6-N-acetyl-D-glucosamine biosynthesis protein PgaD [Xanthomonas campestris]|uniref:poly-beta-1,6-N-acetyl-D-glucosamine biosynthesis protein PgaD n=1 Tax=Xanthomonas campestris TaxID=339 RepID=UPI0022391E6C